VGWVPGSRLKTKKKRWRADFKEGVAKGKGGTLTVFTWLNGEAWQHLAGLVKQTALPEKDYGARRTQKKKKADFRSRTT